MLCSDSYRSTILTLNFRLITVCRREKVILFRNCITTHFRLLLKRRLAMSMLKYLQLNDSRVFYESLNFVSSATQMRTTRPNTDHNLAQTMTKQVTHLSIASNVVYLRGSIEQRRSVECCESARSRLHAHEGCPKITHACDQSSCKLLTDYFNARLGFCSNIATKYLRCVK